jgi:osmoprotectant transport system permease protein
MRRRHYLLAALALAAAGCGRADFVVGSKAFAEPIILGEMARLLAADAGVSADHKRNLGDTSKTWTGLLAGELDAYVEYTGTLTQELLVDEKIRTEEHLREALARRGLKMTKSLGFRNNYALGMREAQARDLGIRKISDLVRHPKLKVGCSNAFIDRADGWHALKRRYNLPFDTPKGMEQSASYLGLAAGDLDVIVPYTTDAGVLRYNVRLLEDDKKFFPAYDAVFLYRADLEARHPKAVEQLRRLEGTIDERTMQRLNDRATGSGADDPTVIAADFLRERFGLRVEARAETRLDRILRMTRDHLKLVGVSLVAAILLAVPLGVVAARKEWLGQGVLALTGVVQTFPALALLSVLIALMGKIGFWPAVVALTLYSLLPIVRNTYTGLHDIPLSVRESAEALGLSAWAKLRLVELPMASRAMMAGIKTAAVINVGFATLGGLVAAGGYGEAIVAGLNRLDWTLLLEGAVPAVVLALLVQGLCELAERLLVPRGLRLKPAE